MDNFNKENSSKPLAVVTGASSGIGYELAKVFAMNGFNLLIAAEDDGILNAGDALRAFGSQVDVVQTDLASAAGVDELYQKIKSLGQPIDSIAMNAGVGVGGEFLQTNLQDELNLIQLNIISLVQLTKKVLKDLVAQGHGRILYTSSIAAEMPGPYYAVYAASKAFVQSFSEAIRNEVKDKGITVTALQPGATETNFFVRAGMLNTKAGKGKKDDAAEVAQDGFKALMAGKDHVVAGSVKNVIQADLAKFLSDSQGASLQGQSVKPDSASKQHH